MSFDVDNFKWLICEVMSQSLWNRAMSFDRKIKSNILGKLVSIPLEQGNVFRLTKGGFYELFLCLNPFGTGQCLSTAVGC